VRTKVGRIITEIAAIKVYVVRIRWGGVF